MPPASISFGEARKGVTDIVTAADPHAAALAYAADTDDPSRLKIVEYALLIPSIKQGVTEYLDDRAVPDDKLRFLGAPVLMEMVGDSIGERTVALFEQDPNKEIINTLAKRRAELVSYGSMVFPVEDTLRGASMFSTSVMLSVALSNALTINAAWPHTDRSREQFIDAVKRSHHPAIARSVMHILWNDSLNNEFYQHIESLFDGRHSLNQDCLVYDPKGDRAVLTQPLDTWVLTKGVDIRSDGKGVQALEAGSKIRDIETSDVRVGCPFSFEPELAKRYYEYFVDTMERAQCWPDMLLSRGNSAAIERLSHLAFQELLDT
jgi:hypothetical protein